MVNKNFTRKDLSVRIFKNLGFSKNLSSKIVDNFFETLISELIKSNKIKVIEKNLKINDLLKADEIFMTGTAAEVKSVTRVNKTKIGDGKIGEVTKELQELFMDTVMGKNKKFRSWLKFI